MLHVFLGEISREKGAEDARQEYSARCTALHNSSTPASEWAPQQDQMVRVLSRGDEAWRALPKIYWT